LPLRARFASAAAALVTIVVVALSFEAVGGLHQNLGKALDERLTQHAQLVSAELGASSAPVTALDAAADAQTGLFVIVRETDGTQVVAGHATGPQPLESGVWPQGGGVAFAYGQGPEGQVRFALLRLNHVLKVFLKNPNVSVSISSVAVGAYTSENDAAVADLIRALVIGGIGALLVAAAAAWLLSGRIARPVTELAVAASTVAREGDLAQRVPERGGPPETKRLARTFNAALQHVQEMYTALENVLIKQRRFVKDASHELRTPLTTMSSTLETISLHPEMDPESRHVVIDGALAEARRMERLIDGLLTLASYDAGEQLSRVEFSWSDLLEDFAQASRQAVAPREFTVEIAEGVGSCWGDRRALRSMLDAAIENVVRYTPEDAHVQMTAACVNDDAVVLTIADDGPGVPAEFADTLTDRFVQVDVARSGEAPGLGLAIAKAIAVGHGGTLETERVSPHGLRVVASIPRGRPSDTPERRRVPRAKNR
jgi:signal transduction histidine kinase